MSVENPSADALRATATMSPSRLKMWFGDCQQKWAFIYVEGKRRPPAAFLSYGKAWDRAISDPIESYWSEVLKGNPHLTPKQLSELFEARWEEESADVEEWEGDTKETLLEFGDSAAQLWAPQVGALHHPLSIQKKFQFGVKGVGGVPFVINGVFDSVLYYDGPNESIDDVISKDLRGPLAVIHDDKTAGKTWLHRTGPKAGKPNRSATTSLQPQAYTLAASEDKDLRDQVDVGKLVFDIALRTKKPELQRVEVTVSPAQRADYLRAVEASRLQMIATIDHGFFYPNRNSFLCSRRWCPFADECEALHGGTVDE